MWISHEYFAFSVVTALICGTAWDKMLVIFHGKNSGHNFCVLQREQQRTEMPGHAVIRVPKSWMHLKVSIFNPEKSYYNHP